MGALWKLFLVFCVGMLMTHNVIGAGITVALTIVVVAVFNAIWSIVRRALGWS